MKSVVIYASEDSAVVFGSHSMYATARSTASNYQSIEFRNLQVGQIYIPPPGLAYEIRRTLLKFDTSSIPVDATIIRARLRMAIVTAKTNSAFDVEVVKQDWSAQDPVWGGDLQTAYANCLAGDVEGVFRRIVPPEVEPENTQKGTYYSADLDISRINPGGNTYYSLRSSNDRENNENSGMESCELANLAGVYQQNQWPVLIVDYSDQPDYDFLGFQLNVDWEGTGAVESWEDEAPRMQRYVLDRGKDRMIGAPGGGFESPAVGKLILTLDNSDGRYDPWNQDGDLYGKLQPGRRANFSVWHADDTYNLFTGYVADIRPEGYRQQATLIIEDGAGWLNSREPDIPLLKAQGVDSAIHAILDNLQYPFGREIESGVDNLDYYWTSGADGLSEIHKLANADMGRFCVDADSVARFRSRHNSEAIAHTITEDKIGKDIYIPMPWDYARSIVKVLVHPRQTGPANSTLWTLRKQVNIPDGETLVLWCEYRYEGQAVPAEDVYIDSYEPVASLDPRDFQLTAFSRDAKVEITNNSGTGLDLTELVIKGQPIYSPDPIGIEESAEAGVGLPATFVFDYEWLTNVNVAQAFAKVLLAYLNDPKQYPEIRIINRPELACKIDLEQRLRLVMPTFGIDKVFFVSKISHQSGTSMQEIISEVKLYPMLQDQGDEVMIYDHPTRGYYDLFKYGF